MEDQRAFGKASVAPIGPLGTLPVPVDVAKCFDARILTYKIEVGNIPRLPSSITFDNIETTRGTFTDHDWLLMVFGHLHEADGVRIIEMQVVENIY